MQYTYFTTLYLVVFMIVTQIFWVKMEMFGL